MEVTTFKVTARGVGLPDYSAPKPTGQVPVGPTYTLTDVAELAARLGSIVTYDRRGTVVYLDDFECPVARIRTIGAYPAILDSTYPFSGAQAVKLLTGAVAPSYSNFDIYLAPQTLGAHGFKISNNLYEMRNFDSQFIIWLELSDGTNLHELGIRLNPRANTLAYWATAGAWVIFERGFLTSTVWPQVFHNMKLVADFTTGKYVRFLFDTLSWDITEYAFAVTANPGVVYTLATFQLGALQNRAMSNWVDDFVYTINEPPNV